MTPRELDAALRKIAADSIAVMPQHVRDRYAAHCKSASKWAARGGSADVPGRLDARALRGEWSA